MMGDRRDSLDVAGPGEIVAVVGLKQTLHRQHAVRPQSADRPGRHPLPRAGHLAGDHPGQDDRRDEAGRRAGQAGARRSDPEVPDRSGDEAADPERHGRAASGSVGREADAHARRQGDGRQADGGLSPDAVQAGRDRDALHQAVGRPRQVRRHLLPFEPLTKEQIEEWTTYQEEQGEKPDPNNLYFLDKIVGGVVPGEYIPSVE